MISALLYLWIFYAIRVEESVVTLTKIEVLSSLNCSWDRTSWWMMVLKSGRKSFWFHHLLKYESTGPFIFSDLVQLEAATGLFLDAPSRSVPASCISLAFSILLPTPSPSPHHLNVAMLSWQLKCFLSACWVNWLSQKCFLPSPC